MKYIKPPEGLMPKEIHDMHRVHDIKMAITRYLEHRKPIPLEWIEEYNELVRS